MNSDGSIGSRGDGRRPVGLAVLRPMKIRRRLAYLVGVAGAAGVTALLLPFRDSITPLSKGFGFLLVVVAAAAVGGLGPGIVAAVVSFLAFNYFFIPPYDTFVIGQPEHVVVLFVFLGLSVLISALLARAQERAAAADAQRSELEMLQELSAQLVTIRSGSDGYTPLLEELVERFGYSQGALVVEDGSELKEICLIGAEPGELLRPWSAENSASSPERMPLHAGGKNVGLVIMKGDRPPLGPAESRVLRAFGDQLAISLERDQLREAEAEAEILRKTDTLRRTLLAAVSHELKSPLAAIKASVTDLLSEDVPHDQRSSREILESIDTESDRLNDLITNLLDMSRIESGMLKAKIADVDPEEVISTCAERAKAAHPGIKVLTSVQTGTLIRADPVFLERVAGNLLENAARSSSSTGVDRIEVLIDEAGDRVVTRVVDHGVGVSQQAREQLFNPFYKFDERNPRLGAGLGLAISKGFMSAMDGEIWLEETSGGGATFAFSLPASTSRRKIQGDS